MIFLDATIAFAVTMLAVANVVSLLLEAGMRLFRVRRGTLKEFLHEFYANELEPLVVTEVHRAKLENAETVKEAAKELVGAVTSRTPEPTQLFRSNPNASGHLPPPAGRLPDSDVDNNRLTNVSTEEMVDRLRRSELGHSIADAFSDAADDVFERIGARYERFGQYFSQSFAVNARIWSTVVGIALAFAANIDSIHLARAYMVDDSARAAAIAAAPAILEESDGPEAENLAANLNTLTQPFPVGWEYFPGCSSDDRDLRCTTAGFGAWWAWLCGCLLTGVLSGLGAPFWYQAVMGLMSVRRAAAPQKSNN